MDVDDFSIQKDIVIIDNGTGYSELLLIIHLIRFTKIGYAGNVNPAFVFPSTYAYNPKDKDCKKVSLINAQ